MLKRISTLAFLFALCVWAADVWTAKPFTDWNEKDIQKVLSDSPWTAKVTISGGPAAFSGPAGGGKGGGGRGGGRSGPQGDGANSDPGVDGGGGPGGGGGDFGGGPSGVDVMMLWQTALPIKQALVKRQYGAEAGTSPEAKAKLDRQEQVYVLTLAGMPAFTLGAAQGDKKAALLETTILTVAGKPPLKAVDVQVTGGGRVGNVSFLFPRTTTFTAEDRDMEFSTKFDKTAVKKKFKLKDMVFNGKVEM